MSRIGNKPVSIPENVEVVLQGDAIEFKGSKGTFVQKFEPDYVEVVIEDGVMNISRKDETKESKSRHGLYRSLFQNAVVGVSEGFSKTLEIRGVGYRFENKGNALEFNLGYSHPISFPIPESVEIKIDEENKNIFTLSSIDKQLVGQLAANIRALRKPEPYKGKGIRYIDEYVRIKAGKSAASAK